MECSIPAVSSNTACSLKPPTPPAVATILISIREAQTEIARQQALIDEHKLHLQDLLDEGLITDTVSHDGITAKVQQRKTWQYSPAVKELQDMEQLEGIATQKVTSSWTVRFSSSDA